LILSRNIGFSSDCIPGVRDLHQFDADINGFISSRRISQSTSATTHKFQIQRTNQSSISQVLDLSGSTDDLFIIIEENGDFRLAQVHSADPSISLLNVSCFDPPLPSSTFVSSKSPHLDNLIISSEQFRASLIENPIRLANDGVRVTPQQFLDIQNLLKHN
jgi:hypothetical protein